VHSDRSLVTAPTPTPKPTLRRRLIRLGILVVTGYALYGCSLMSFQDRLIFPRDVPGPRQISAKVPTRWEQMTIKAEDGSVVPAWLHLPLHRQEGERVPVVMFFHGNAEIIDQIAEWPGLEIFNSDNVAVLLVEFRGYGRAGGAPSEAAIS